jgi:fucose permease
MQAIAIATVFFLNGAGLATWVPHIPTVQARLDLGPAALGAALFAMAVGALGGIALAGRVMARVGSRLVLRSAALVFFAALLLPLRAADVWQLAAALAVLGAGNGAMDVAMNAQAAALEQRTGRTLMSRFHGMWSIGGLAGAAAAALALHAGMTPEAHVGTAAAMVVPAVALALGGLRPGEGAAGARARRTPRPRGLLARLGALALVALVAEGAMGDWSALYLRQTLGTTAGLAALGFAAFSGTMAAGRLLGDAVVARVGSVALVRIGAGAGAVGFGAALACAQPMAALLGCGAVGLALANIIPIVFRAAARAPGAGPGAGLATVAGAGYLGFLVGPPLLGLAAEAAGLPVALALIVAALAWISASAHVVAADC